MKLKNLKRKILAIVFLGMIQNCATAAFLSNSNDQPEVIEAKTNSEFTNSKAQSQPLKETMEKFRSRSILRSNHHEFQD